MVCDVALVPVICVARHDDVDGMCFSAEYCFRLTHACPLLSFLAAAVKSSADPHPGNLLVTPEGKLCLIDFGLCAEVDPDARAGMTKAIVNLLARDFHSLVHKDAKQLGFLPHDYDTTELQPLLTKILTGGLLEAGSNLHSRKRKLMEISNELNQVFFQYPFSVPPFFALVTRGLGLLEGIALTGDPEFDIFRASAPYATKRAMQMAMSRSWTTQRNPMVVATSTAQ